LLVLVPQELKASIEKAKSYQEKAGIRVPTPSKEIHVRYSDQTFFFDQNMLKFFGVSNVGHLIGVIKPKLETSTKIY
jgi:hypothetical protein